MLLLFKFTFILVWFIQSRIPYSRGIWCSTSMSYWIAQQRWYRRNWRTCGLRRGIGVFHQRGGDIHREVVANTTNDQHKIFLRHASAVEGNASWVYFLARILLIYCVFVSYNWNTNIWSRVYGFVNFIWRAMQVQIMSHCDGIVIKTRSPDDVYLVTAIGCRCLVVLWTNFSWRSKDVPIPTSYDET